MSSLQYGVIVLLEFSPSWLSLSRENRRELAGGLYAIIGKYAGQVHVEYYDADAFHGSCSDYVVCRTADLKHYHYMWEEIRDSPVYAGGYMRIKDVITGIRNGYQAYESEVLNMP
ncbi:Darcynin, protein of unknown function [Paenibacillus sp. UNCCL117]|uniref:darcynin family protein n=1 Tax=unclassified Paenibacillus TaxID=185978 RepID=UPI000889E270|nr:MULTISPECIES: darcynin family protein [unclassified Paenibacillus]SDC91604.1 Darcynin, protein of unknown function [Paenibacillus sp. cl123]SFW29110.1 Darcynin, protein of unknown function [Paenibacillus sp. UNCCL117]